MHINADAISKGFLILAVLFPFLAVFRGKFADGAHDFASVPLATFCIGCALALDNFAHADAGWWVVFLCIAF